MCGFVGFVDDQNGRDKADASEILRRAAETIQHRGPDDEGVWVADDGRVGFGFRRLSILDLTDHGHQPMASIDGRYHLVFNGEIYNFKDLRAALDGESQHPWKGHSDTEVLLEMIRRRGLTKTLAQVDGMFAMALWDTETHTLTLARDRFGEKPLYYGWSGRAFVFGSELKALKALPDFDRALDRESLALYFRFRYVPGAHCIYKSYRKVEPGTVVVLAAGKTRIERYWSALKDFKTASSKPFQGGREDALGEVSKVFQNAVSRRLESDVPLGIFLSGGIDSSLVAAYAQHASSTPVNTFTIGFEEQHYNEAPYAKVIAEHLGTHHNETIVRSQDTLAIVDALATLYDEPFADPSQLPTVLLCAKAKKHVTVALSGDGGDELFCGYGRYLSQIQRWQDKGSPNFANIAVKKLPVSLLNRLDGIRGKPGKLGHKWLTRLLDQSCDQAEEFFMFASSFWRDGVPVLGIDRWERALFAPETLDLGGVPDVTRFQIFDTIQYLPDDVLVKTDRASMAASLEVRTPFLSIDLARLMWSLPFDLVDPTRHGLKSILKDLLARRVPKKYFERPKQGFDAPIRTWIRGDLKAWGDDLINNPSTLAQEYLDMPKIEKRWHDHQNGLNREGDLWPALVMLGWMKAQS